MGGPGQKERFIRPEDALDYLFEAVTAPKEQRDTHLQFALEIYYFGLLNRHVFKVKEKRSGRPEGTGGPRIDDTNAVALMRKIADDTGERSPMKLARAVVRMGHVGLDRTAVEGSVVKRLASRYQQTDRQK